MSTAIRDKDGQREPHMCAEGAWTAPSSFTSSLGLPTPGDALSRGAGRRGVTGEACPHRATRGRRTTGAQALGTPNGLGRAPEGSEQSSASVSEGHPAGWEVAGKGGSQGPAGGLTGTRTVR